MVSYPEAGVPRVSVARTALLAGRLITMKRSNASRLISSMPGRSCICPACQMLDPAKQLCRQPLVLQASTWWPVDCA